MEKENTKNIIIKGNRIDFSSLTLRQKIAQMIIVRGDPFVNFDFCKLNIGGIRLHWQNSKEDYKNLIDKYQSKSKIRLFAAADLEGSYSSKGIFGNWNPFHSFRKFPSFAEIKDKKEAYEIGIEHGKLLKEMGFNMNFAPVAEFKDKSYGGRAFSGSKEKIKEKLKNYIKGLQKNVFGTCKHYPGRGMIKNTHLRRDKQVISRDDLELFEVCFKNKITNVMIGHQIAKGELDSKGKPSSVSSDVIDSLKDLGFKGLVISDEINMLGLKSFYVFNKRKLYRDLINSGENIILDFLPGMRSLYKTILKVEEDVKNGKIDEGKIDESAKKILKVKGYRLIGK